MNPCVPIMSFMELVVYLAMSISAVLLVVAIMAGVGFGVWLLLEKFGRRRK